MKNKRIVGIVFLFVMILSVSFIAGAASSATFYFDDAPRGYVRAYAGYVSKVGKDVVTLKYRNKTKEVYLARRKYTEFKDLYLLYLESTK